jgi:hypothetical protein
MKRFGAFLIFSLLLNPVQSADPLPTLAETQARYQQEREDRAVAMQEKARQLQKAYLAALLEQESRARAAQDIDRVVSFREEIAAAEARDPTLEVPPPHPEELKTLRETWNRSIQELQAETQADIKSLTERVLSYAQARRNDLLAREDIDQAVAWRNWERELQQSLPPETATEDQNITPSPGIGIPYQLTLWNTHHSHLANWGTLEVHIKGFYQDRVVFQKRNVPVDWKSDGPARTDIAMQIPSLDRLEIEISKSKGRGPGLSEIELIRGANTPIRFRKVEVSSAYSRQYRGELLTDGIKDSKHMARGYWLSANRKTATIVLELE